MKLHQLSDVDIGKTVSISQTKVFILHILFDSLYSATSHGFRTGIDKRYLPRLNRLLMNVHVVGAQIKGDIRLMQK